MTMKHASQPCDPTQHSEPMEGEQLATAMLAVPSDAGLQTAALNGKVKKGRGLSPIYLDDAETGQLSIALPRSRRRRIVFG